MTGEQNRKAKAASRGRDNQTVRLRDTMSDCVVVSLSPLPGVRRGTCASVHIGRRQPGVTLCQKAPTFSLDSLDSPRPYHFPSSITLPLIMATFLTNSSSRVCFYPWQNQNL
ncbi:hypothetical protein RRG08_023811 [Elysia crispata]|uniref:Uncharacterized protein n=1 Tax=Elysia crispata TaxID=231223 RepID=A0AAE1DMW8_9GAST|nr:hypothetical protein RRG08_023811 [Elysia crispata]